MNEAPGKLTHGIDGRGRFREIYQAVRADHGHKLPDDRPCEEALVRLPGEQPARGQAVHLGPSRLPLRIVVVPGLVADCFKNLFSPFAFARDHLEQHGFKSSVIWVSGRSSSEHNAAQINTALTNGDYPLNDRLVLIGYSKGVVDILEALVRYPQVRTRTIAVVSLAGTVRGTPLVDKAPRLFRFADKLLLYHCASGDGRSLESLKPAIRQAWLQHHTLPAEISYFSITGIPRPEAVSRTLRPSYRMLAKEDPRNDSQVIFYDSFIPGSTLIGYVNADHWAITLPIARVCPWLGAMLVNRNAFPREVLLEAIVRYVEEFLHNKSPLSQQQVF
jgi:hypothetical protein